MSQSGSDEPLVVVRLLQLPLEVHQRSREHGDELIRELTLIGAAMRGEGETNSLPPRLVSLVAELTGRYGGFTASADERLDQAIAAGETSVDLFFEVPESAGGAARRLAAVLAEADEYCRAGRHLLTLATPPELVRYRSWYLGEFGEQIAGRPALPWPHFAGSTG